MVILIGRMKARQGKARLAKKKIKKEGRAMDAITKKLIQFILKKVEENTTPQRPYYILKWSGLTELCNAYGKDLLKIIDYMAEQKLIKKALIPTKTGKKKLLAIALPNRITSKKAKNLLQEFEEFEA